MAKMEKTLCRFLTDLSTHFPPAQSSRTLLVLLSTLEMSEDQSPASWRQKEAIVRRVAEIYEPLVDSDDTLSDVAMDAIASLTEEHGSDLYRELDRSSALIFFTTNILLAFTGEQPLSGSHNYHHFRYEAMRELTEEALFRVSRGNDHVTSEENEIRELMMLLDDEHKLAYGKPLYGFIPSLQQAETMRGLRTLQPHSDQIEEVLTRFTGVLASCLRVRGTNRMNDESEFASIVSKIRERVARRRDEIADDIITLKTVVATILKCSVDDIVVEEDDARHVHQKTSLLITIPNRT